MNKVTLMTPSHARPLAALLLAAAASACSAGVHDTDRYALVDAEVELIDRTCMMRTYMHRADGIDVPIGKHEPGDCYEDEKFQAMRDHPDSKHMTVDGTAEMSLVYRDPISKRMMHGKLKFDGTDREFYAVNAHDRMKILVSKTDPKDIQKL